MLFIHHDGSRSNSRIRTFYSISESTVEIWNYCICLLNMLLKLKLATRIHTTQKTMNSTCQSLMVAGETCHLSGNSKMGWRLHGKNTCRRAKMHPPVVTAHFYFKECLRLSSMSLRAKVAFPWLAIGATTTTTCMTRTTTKSPEKMPPAILIKLTKVKMTLGMPFDKRILCVVCKVAVAVRATAISALAIALLTAIVSISTPRVAFLACESVDMKTLWNQTDLYHSMSWYEWMSTLERPCDPVGGFYVDNDTPTIRVRVLVGFQGRRARRRRMHWH